LFDALERINSDGYRYLPVGLILEVEVGALGLLSLAIIDGTGQRLVARPRFSLEIRRDSVAPAAPGVPVTRNGVADAVPKREADDENDCRLAHVEGGYLYRPRSTYP
jgi:hypothetical protein